MLIDEAIIKVEQRREAEDKRNVLMQIIFLSAVMNCTGIKKGPR